MGTVRNVRTLIDEHDAAATDSPVDSSATVLRVWPGHSPSRPTPGCSVGPWCYPVAWAHGRIGVSPWRARARKDPEMQVAGSTPALANGTGAALAAPEPGNRAQSAPAEMTLRLGGLIHTTSR